MGEDNSRCVQFQTAFDHFARVDAGAVNSPGKQDFIVDDTVAVIRNRQANTSWGNGITRL